MTSDISWFLISFFFRFSTRLLVKFQIDFKFVSSIDYRVQVVSSRAKIAESSRVLEYSSTQPNTISPGLEPPFKLQMLPVPSNTWQKGVHLLQNPNSKCIFKGCLELSKFHWWSADSKLKSNFAHLLQTWRILGPFLTSRSFKLSVFLRKKVRKIESWLFWRTTCQVETAESWPVLSQEIMSYTPQWFSKNDHAQKRIEDSQKVVYTQ